MLPAKLTRQNRYLLATLILGPIGTPAVQAAIYYWDSNGGEVGFGAAAGTWAAPTIGGVTQGWTTDAGGGTLPTDVTTAAGDLLSFGDGGTGLGSGSIAVSGTVAAGSLSFAPGSGGVALTGGTINLAAAPFMAIDSPAASISSVLTGAGTSLTKTGTGVLTLSGANTFAGSLSVQAGILAVGTINNNSANGPLGNNANAVTLGNAGGVTGTLQYTGATASSSKKFTTATGGTGAIQVDNAATTLTLSGVINGSGHLAKTGPGTLLLSATNTYTGDTIIQGGNLSVSTLSATGTNSRIGAGSTAATSLTFDGGTLLYTGTTSNTVFNRNITLKAGGGILSLAGAATTNFWIKGAMTGPGSFTKVGNMQLIVTVNGNYDGVTYINGGELQIRDACIGLGSTVGKTVVANGAQLAVGGGTVFVTPVTENIDLNGNGSNGKGALQVPDGITATFAGTITLATNSGIGSNSQNFEISGPIVGPGTFTKLGTPVLTLSGASTYTGATNISAGTLNLTGSLDGTSAIVTSGAGILNGSATGVIGGAASFSQSSTGTSILAGANSYTGPTSVTAGTLMLDYSSADSSKLADSAPLVLGGGTLDLVGGTHTEIVASTTLTAATASTVTNTSPGAILRMNTITRGAGASVNFAYDGIATTDNTNVNGIIGAWATVGGTDWATNSTNGADGPIVAYSAYSNVPRLTPGTITSNAAANVRLVEGSGSSGSILVASATTTVNSINQSDFGGTSDAMIDPAGRTLRTNNILVGPNAGALTIGTGTNNGTLGPATVGGDLTLIHNGALPLTINSAIANNSVASSLSKAGSGTLVLGGANAFTGGLTISGGTVELGNSGALNSTVGSENAVNFGASSGTLALMGNSVTVASLTGSSPGAVVANANGLVVDNATLTVGNGTQPGGTFAGILRDGTGGGTLSLTKADAGTLILTGTNTYTGLTAVDAGVLQLGNGTANGTLTTGIHQLAAGSTLFLNNLTAVSASTGGYATRVRGAGTFRLASAQGANGTANWGPGSATATPFNNEFTGTLQLDNGRYDAGANGLGGITQVVINSGAQFMAWTGAFPQNFVLAGAGWGEVGFPGALRVAGGNNATFNGGITLTGNAGFNSQDTGATMTINGTITGGFGISKENPGLLVLNGTNDYTGDTTISSGTLRIGNAAALGSSSGGTSIASGATLDLNGQTIAEPFVGIVGTGVGGNGALINSSVTPAAITAPINLGILAFSVGGSGDTTLAQVNGTGPGATLTKVGAGTLTLSGVNTYTGATTVSAGTLTLAGGSQASPVTVSAGASLGFSLGSPTSSTSSFNLAAGSIKITGTPTAASYTLISSSASITGTPVLAAPIAGYQLQVTGGNVLKLVQTSGYSTWAAINAPTGTDADDFDNDGVANGLEYVLGGTKDTKDLGKLPKMVVSGGNLVFTFNRDQASIDGITTMAVTAGTNLTSWPISYAVPGTAVTANPGLTVVKDSPTTGYDSVTLVIPQAPDLRKFARLTVKVTP